jgi:hypothetical protein
VRAADVEWNERYLLRAEGGYVPRFKLETAVLRVPVVPGSDPRIAYGDLVERGGCNQMAGEQKLALRLVHQSASSA